MGAEADNVDPLNYPGIREACCRTFEGVRQERFVGKVLDGEDLGLPVYPLSRLLGISAERAMKGIILFRSERPGRTYDLVEGLGRIEDAGLSREMDEILRERPLPAALIEANSLTPPVELAALYRTARFQIEMLYLIYDRPFRSRYPGTGGGVCLPNLSALHGIVRVLHRRLAAAARTRRVPS